MGAVILQFQVDNSNGFDEEDISLDTDFNHATDVGDVGWRVSDWSIHFDLCEK